MARAKSRNKPSEEGGIPLTASDRELLGRILDGTEPVDSLDRIADRNGAIAFMLEAGFRSLERTSRVASQMVVESRAFRKAFDVELARPGRVAA